MDDASSNSAPERSDSLDGEEYPFMQHYIMLSDHHGSDSTDFSSTDDELDPTDYSPEPVSTSPEYLSDDSSELSGTRRVCGLWYDVPSSISTLMALKDCLICRGASGVVNHRDDLYPSRPHWFCDMQTYQSLDRREALRQLNRPDIPSVVTPYSTASVAISQETDEELKTKLTSQLKQNLVCNTEVDMSSNFRTIPLQRINYDTARFLFTQTVFYDYYGLNCSFSRLNHEAQELVPKDDEYITACRRIYVALFGDPMSLEQQAYSVVEDNCHLREATDWDMACWMKKKLESTYWFSRDVLVNEEGDALDSDAIFVVINRELSIACGFYCFMSRVYG